MESCDFQARTVESCDFQARTVESCDFWARTVESCDFWAHTVESSTFRLLFQLLSVTEKIIFLLFFTMGLEVSDDVLFYLGPYYFVLLL